MVTIVGERMASDPTNVRQKMMELRLNQKADVVLKQELGLYRRLHDPEYPQLRVQVAFSRSCGCVCVALGNVTGLRLFRVT